MKNDSNIILKLQTVFKYKCIYQVYKIHFNVFRFYIYTYICAHFNMKTIIQLSLSLYQINITL